MKTLKEALKECRLNFENDVDGFPKDALNEICLSITATPIYSRVEYAEYEGIERLSGWLFKIETENQTITIEESDGKLSVVRPLISPNAPGRF